MALLALPGAAAAVPPTGVSTATPLPLTAPAPGSAEATLRVCHVAVEQAQRSATFVSQMTATATSNSMEMRLRLFVRTGRSGRFAVVDAPGLGLWQRAQSGRNAFIYAKQVTNLTAPAQYRVAVSYRWLDGNGTVIARAHRRSGICVQPDQSASLAVTRVDVGGGGYTVRIHNHGRVASDPLALTLTVGGVAQRPVSVPAVPAHGSASVDVIAPACQPGTALSVGLTAITAPGVQSSTRVPVLPVTFACASGPQIPTNAPHPLSATRRASRRAR